MRLGRLVIAIFVTACLLAASGVLAVSSPASAAGSPSGVLISQLRTRSATSQYDEYVQITNTSNAAVDLSGWQLYDCYQSSGAQKLGTDGNPAAGRHDAARRRRRSCSARMTVITPASRTRV